MPVKIKSITTVFLSDHSSSVSGTIPARNYPILLLTSISSTCRTGYWCLYVVKILFNTPNSQPCWVGVRLNCQIIDSVTEICFMQLDLTRGLTSFALYCILENKSIKSAISSLFLTDTPELLKPPAAEGDAAIIVPRPAVLASSRTLPPSKTAEACPLGQDSRPGHSFPVSFFLTARFRGPEPGSLR